jgi:hypothetical protein
MRTPNAALDEGLGRFARLLAPSPPSPSPALGRGEPKYFGESSRVALVELEVLLFRR